MKLKFLAQVTFLLLLSVCTAQAATTLTVIGRHPFYKPPLKSVDDLRSMVQTQQTSIMEGLEAAGMPELYTPLMQQFPQAQVQQIEYQPGESFHWMLFRTNGVGRAKAAMDLIWGGKAALSGYEFFIDAGENRYIFAVPLFCGNLALKEVVPAPAPIVEKVVEVPVPGPVQYVDRIKEVEVPGPERIVQVPGPERVVEVPGPERVVEVPGPERVVEVPGPERVVEVPGPERIVEKVVEVPGPERIVEKVVEVPGPERIVEKVVKIPGPERIVQVPGPERIVEKIVEAAPPCCPECIYPVRFVADMGYLRLSDPADFGFGRIGVEYAFNQRLSFLGMIGGATKVDGSDGDDAWLIDFMLQYNLFFLQVADRWNPVFLGFGLGGWMSNGDDDIDSEDSDIDIIAQIGAQVFGHPDSFNTSVFFEARSGIDETDKLSEYGRFGAGLRFRF
ncbi:MAG: IMCp domain-containing protein [Candidatus Electrothrix sp. Rat3]|nr:IMCp domain-containing protein [Candidatus Electrothrix rattekaaiensis]